MPVLLDFTQILIQLDSNIAKSVKLDVQAVLIVCLASAVSMVIPTTVLLPLVFVLLHKDLTIGLIPILL